MRDEKGRPAGSPLRFERVVLARGAERSPGVQERVLGSCPEARLERQPDVPPCRAELSIPPGEDRRTVGKRTLVLGRIGRVLDRNCEPGMGERVVCFPYWHFSAVGNCPYDCKFCYLAGNRGNMKCPAVKVYTNLEEVMAAIGRVADRAEGPVLFYGSKLQDFVALDPLTEYSRALVPFAAAHPNIRLLFLTKSAAVDGFLDLDHGGHTILSWTLNAEVVIGQYEVGTPTLAERLDAARRAADAGYEVRFVFMPMIPMAGWRERHAEAMRRALAAVRASRITLGGICMYQPALSAMRRRRDVDEGCLRPILDNLERPPTRRERFRFRPEMRQELYGHMIDGIREIDPTIPVSLCLETPEVWRSVGLDPTQPACNCLL